MNKIAVIERPKLIILTKLDITAITDEMSDIPVLDADVDVRDRLDRGTIVLKIFSVEKTDAGEITDKLSDMKPQYAEVWVDEISNQIIALGDIGLMQQYDKIIRELDQKWINRTLHTFRLKWPTPTRSPPTSSTCTKVAPPRKAPASGPAPPAATTRTTEAPATEPPRPRPHPEWNCG